MKGLTVALLGPGRIELDGQALTRLLAPKHQALVFVLAAEGRACSREQLATLLWGELDEAAARGNLRGALTRLRRWLPGVLAADAQLVGFAEPSAVAVDLQALQLAQQAGELPHAQRMAAASAWRGPLLDGFDVGVAEGFDEWLSTARRRATLAVTALRHDLLNRAEAAGRPDEGLVHAQALLDIDDADETAHMALMRLLAGAGRRTAAIAQYEACRAALAQRLGAKPSAACYALYTRIHADAVPVAGIGAVTPLQTAALGDTASPPVAQVPSAAPAVPGVPRAPEAIGDGAAVLPSHGDAEHAISAAAAPGKPLIGRDRELALIAERLADPACRWLTLVGPGGVGKTRLALAVAAAHGAAQRHGVLLLSGRDDAAGDPLRDGQTLLQAVLARVGSDRRAPGALLLVLDNLETASAARHFEPLLREGAPGVTVLATSRMRVGGGREWLLELEGLSLERANPDMPASSPAAELLEAAARRLSPRFRAAAEAEAVERICTLVGGLPLALEMAGRGVHTAGAAAVAERIAAGVPLADADRDDADRHHSIDTVMHDAWSLLDAPAQAAALRLAQLPAAFDAALAQAAGVAVECLADLRERAWLARVDAPLTDAPGFANAGGWLALHPLQQAWLRRRADAGLAADVAAALHRALAPVLPTVAPFGEIESSALLPPLALSVAAASPVLAAASRYACANEHEEALAPWVDGAVALLHRCGRQADAAALLAQALQRPDLTPLRRVGWMMRRVEMLDGDGRGSLAQRVRRAALVAYGLPDVAAEEAGWADVLRARRAVGQRWRSLPTGAVRDAFGALLVRQCIHNANALSFLPDPGPVLRAGALADAACSATRAPVVMRWIGGAWGSASLGHPAVARFCARLSREPRQPPMPPRNTALLDGGRAVMRLITGEWEGLSASLDAAAAQYGCLGGGRHEMEVRSLGAKLALYEGRLADAWDRFAQMSELALRRPGESWRAWGPIGQCEVGLCWSGTDDAMLQRLLERSTQLLSEMENFDAAYVLRRHGVAARLAWRRGDADAAREAVRAGTAAAGRTRQFGFWAHEGLSALGDVLAGLRLQATGNGDPERADRGHAACGAQGALGTAWAALAPALDAHQRRFPPAASMCARVRAMQAMADGQHAKAHSLLEQSVTLAERQGARVDQARALDALAALQVGRLDGASECGAARHAAQLWQAMAAGRGGITRA